MKKRIEDTLQNIRLSVDENSLIILDQSLLPNETVFLELSTATELYDAIFTLKVRGAPAIGIFAAYALFILSKQSKETVFHSFLQEFRKNKAYLNSSRPTAVNLSKMLNRMESVVLGGKDKQIEDILEDMKSTALAIHKEDMEMCLAISKYGLELVEAEFGILTHCNAGPLATSRYGTGLGSLILGKEQGMDFHVYCDETRPLLQGARLTTYELQKAGIDCTLICDNMAATVMNQGKIDACFVGCDRVAKNGDAANKIGTLGVAILAKHYEIPFYVFCPSSTIDFSIETGSDITIEERPPEEINQMFFEKPMAPEAVPCYNPAFDVTPHHLITAIITERGICRAPFDESFRKLFGEELGWKK